jgi:hypothetical protein
VVILLLSGPECRSGTFLFLSFFSSFFGCVTVLLLRCCVITEASCNWYLLILIYSPYRKIRGRARKSTKWLLGCPAQHTLEPQPDREIRPPLLPKRYWLRG